MSQENDSRPATGTDWGARQSRLALALVAITCLAYLPTLWAGFIWDDDDYVVENASLRDTVGLVRIWTDPQATPQYYPLVHTTFWIEQHLWGLNPTGYHVTNVLLHALSAVCLWRLLQRWQVPGAWLCAAVFALHPVHVESVAWVTERKNVLSTFWYLIAASLYWRFAESQPGESARKWTAVTWWRYLGAFAAFVLALLSKTVACSLPAALLLIVWWRRGTLRAADWLRLVPFFGVGLGFAWLTSLLERTHVGTAHIQLGLQWSDRLVLAGRAVWFYLGKLLWPESLTFIYPKWPIRADQIWQWSGLVGALVLLVTLGRLRHRIGRGPLVAALFFGGTLLPALGFFDVFPMRYSFVADHFQYLASLGPIVLLVSGAWYIANSLMGSQFDVCAWQISRNALASGSTGASALRLIELPRAKRLSSGAATLVLLALGVLTWRQACVYRDLETLWRDTLAKNPSAAIAHNNLAAILDKRGDVAGALAHLEESVRLDPQPESQANLGLLLATLGRVEESIAQYHEALRREPRSAAIRVSLAQLLMQLERHDEALLEFQRAVELRPRDVDLRLQFAESLHSAQRTDDALRVLDVVVELAPNHPRLWFDAGVIWLERDPPKAVAAFERAANLSPTAPGVFFRLGLARERTGDLTGAASAFRKALRLRPRWPEANEALNRVAAQLSADCPAEGLHRVFTKPLMDLCASSASCPT